MTIVLYCVILDKDRLQLFINRDKLRYLGYVGVLVDIISAAYNLRGVIRNLDIVLIVM